jgi:peptide/nickel transport system permease protein
MGQLAIFNVFVGGSTMYVDPVEFVSRTNEWTGLIGQARNYLYVYQWILVFPLLAYLLFIFGFHLISVGLESIYKDKYSKVSHL